MWSKNRNKSNYTLQNVLFIVSKVDVFDQIRRSSVNRKIRKHLHFVLIVDFIFNPSLRVMTLCLECPDLKGLINQHSYWYGTQLNGNY